MKSVSRSVFGAVVIGLMALPVLSQAAVKSDRVDINRVVISYDVQDLKSAEGRAALEREIRTAARVVCETSDYSKTRSLQDLAGSRSCYEQVIAGALSDLGTGELQVSAR